MGVNHRGFQIAMAQQSLNGADVGAALQQMRCETVPKGMGADPLVDTDLPNGGFDRFVDQRLIDVMTASQAG